MCGISGWVDLKNNLTTEQNFLEQMSEKLSPRGPDASGTWLSPHALIAHRRLTVIDPVGGGQPMIRSRGDCSYIITYNGELYNTMDLRKELESSGHVFLSNSDTEVLLVSYMEWGPECVNHLNGIFAFAIWDDKMQRLFLARDRFGVKPLFYIQCGSSFIFASELKSLLVNPLVEPRVDSEGLAEIFALGPARTPGHGVFRNVYEVKPAHCMIFNKSGLHILRYWSLESRPHTDSLETTVDTVRELVTDSIVRQFVSDVPICTFLSGGLDSSAITALAADYFKNTGKGQLNTYSIDYTDNERYFRPSSYQPNSDAPWVKLMSGYFDTYHHYITVDTPQLVNALFSAVQARDLPGMADIDSSLWLFCREIREDAVVALSGECTKSLILS